MALRRRRLIPVSEWVERYRVLPLDSAVPGKWQNSTTPYLVGIMDAVMCRSIQHVVVCAPPQTGKTDLSLNIVGYTADRIPGNWLIVYPDEKTAVDMSRDRVQPLFKESPRLRSYVTKAVDDLSTLRLRLKHAKIYMAWANSAARLASRPLPYVLLDEVDKFPLTAGRKETSPITLAEKRTRTFAHRRKILRVSTPTIESGPIWQAINTECEAVFVYWVRCPDCDCWQQMEFTSIKWEGGSDADFRQILSDARSTWYECTGCAEKWDDTKRDMAVLSGKWRERDSGVGLETYLAASKPVVIGFHYRAWISRFVPLREPAAAFLRALKDKNKLKDFNNDYCAEPWRLVEKERSEDSILALCDDRPRGLVPADNVAYLTCGVDTQDDGFWYWIQAWGFAEPGQRPPSWCIRAGFVVDFYSLSEVLWGDHYYDVEGNPYVVQFGLQDAGGHRTHEVYNFCRVHQGRLIPSFGKRVLAAPFRWGKTSRLPGTKRMMPGDVRKVEINTTYFKNAVSQAMQIAAGDPGGIALYEDFPMSYALQLAAEYMGEEGYWECPAGRDNHLWDCLVLNFTAADIIGVKHRPQPRQPPPENRMKPNKERVPLW